MLFIGETTNKSKFNTIKPNQSMGFGNNRKPEEKIVPKQETEQPKIFS